MFRKQCVSLSPRVSHNRMHAAETGTMRFRQLIETTASVVVGTGNHGETR